MLGVGGVGYGQLMLLRHGECGATDMPVPWHSDHWPMTLTLLTCHYTRGISNTELSTQLSCSPKGRTSPPLLGLHIVQLHHDLIQHYRLPTYLIASSQLLVSACAI